MPWIQKCSVGARPRDYGDGLTPVIFARMINTKRIISSFFMPFRNIAPRYYSEWGPKVSARKPPTLGVWFKS